MNHGMTRCQAHWPTPPHGSGVPVGANRRTCSTAAADGFETVQ